MPALLVAVRLHDGRYHGRPDWPPSPARLFQALVAGAARGAALGDPDRKAIAWLETLAPPTIAAPRHRRGQGYSSFVPNNDLDAVGGNPERVNEIRTAKPIRPILFDADTPLLYVWRFDATDHDQALRLCVIAERLYQLGRGVDMAWAAAEILDADQTEERLANYDGAVHRPTGGGEGIALSVPTPGSLASLIARHAHRRFETTQSNRRRAQLFRQPPKPLFRQIGYDSPPTCLLFDLTGECGPAPLSCSAALAEELRDAAAARLKAALPAKTAEIERCLIGRGADEADKERRVRITPLPSIGHPQTSPLIRRALVEIPSACPLRADDVAWAFSGLELLPAKIDEESGEVREQRTLTTAADRGMLRHYGLENAQPARLWRTVTPAALPIARRGVRRGGERLQVERDAASAVCAALRHAGVLARVDRIRVQCEPWTGKGERAERFAHGRFERARLWHVEISFRHPQSGPLVIGDGRYLGLGLMHPVKPPPGVEGGVHAFAIRDGLADGADAASLTRALRRAVMANVAESLGGAPMPTFFSGHEDNERAQSGGHRHLAYVFDAARARLLVLAPHIIEHRAPTRDERRNLIILADALRDMRELRAGRAGRLQLTPVRFEFDTDPLFAPAAVWESATQYRVTRHGKLGSVSAALEADIQAEIRRLKAPAPSIDILSLESVKGEGLNCRARLRFETAVAGPFLIGRDRHFGGGLYQHSQPQERAARANRAGGRTTENARSYV